MGVGQTSIRTRSAILGVASSLVLGALPAIAQDQSTQSEQQIEIAGGPLGDTLVELGERFNVNIIAPDRLVRGKSVGAVSGSLTPEDALEQVLEGTGLEATPRANNAFLISEAEPVSELETEAQVEPPMTDPDPLVADTITVTGQKVERSLQDTTSSVVVLQESLVQDLTFTEITDLYRFAPNVGQLDSSEGTFSIRGVPAIGGVGFGGRANTSTLYVDDVFQSDLGIEAGPAGVFDIDQVEIYRGPQSTIQGRNALMGAVIIRTQDPTYEWGVKGRVEYSEFNTQRYGLAVGGPIVDDVVAFRLAGDFRKTDGFVTNPTTGRDDLDEDEALTLRAKLLVEPTDRLSALVTYIYSEGDASSGLGSGVVQGPDFFDRTVNVANPVLQSITSHNISAKLTYELSDHITIEAVTGYSDADEESAPRFEVDPDAIDFLDIGFDKQEILTTDLRVLYEKGPLNLLGGFFYFDREGTGERDLSGELVLGGGLIRTNISFLSSGASQVENYAFYVDGEYDLSDRLSLLFGGRYDREEFANQSQSSSIFDPEFPQFGLETSIGVVRDIDTTFDAFLPKAGLRFDLTDTQTVGLVAQRGYRSGGAGINAANTPFEYDSEFLWNYELSYRSTWLDGRTSLNANIFYVDWTGQQVVTGNGINTVTVNAGESRLWGIEAEVFAQATDDLTLFTTFGYNNTEFTDFDSVDPRFNGKEFRLAPDFQASFGAVYTNDFGLFASVDGTYVSDAFSDPENSPSDIDPTDNALDSYFVVNAKVGYEADNWALYGFVRNAFDEEYALRINREDDRSGGLGSAVLGAPQVFGAELTFEY